MLAVDATQVTVTIAVAVLALIAGYALRLREWLKDRRLDAYANLAAAVDTVAATRAQTFSIWIQLGDSLRTEGTTASAALVREYLQESDDALRDFRRAAQRGSLLSTRATGKAQVKLTEYVSANLAPLKPYGEQVAVSASNVLEEASVAVWKYLAVAVKDSRRGKIETAEPSE